MIKFQIPVESGNEMMRSGKIAKVFEMLMEDLKPEAAYFYPDSGLRAGHIIVDMQDSSRIAEAVERFCFGLNANVELTPVMNADDLGKALSGLETIIGRYG